jgi:hypothetical protein
MDVDKLLKSLDNEKNEVLLNFTTKKIKEMNSQILKELHLSKEETKELFIKLKEYRYTDEVLELKQGNYIRWINILNPGDINLSKGAVLCDIMPKEEGTYLRLKNIFGPIFQIKMDECLIFQKLSEQEKILLMALDTLSLTK